MSRTASRVLWAVAGALLVISGVICLLYPEVALATLALYLGFVLLVCGVIDIVIFVKGHKFLYGAGWFLVDGILTVVISLFLLFNNAFTMLTLPFLFGMWLLMSGISKAVNSFDLKALGVSGWGWFLAFGGCADAGQHGWICPDFTGDWLDFAGGFFRQIADVTALL